MDWENLSPQRKIEVLGFLYFNRYNEEGWEQHNAFYASEDGLVNVELEEDENEEEVYY